MIILPFKIEQTMGGLGQAQGLLSLEDDHLRVQTTSLFLGLMRAGACDVRIRLTDLDEVRFAKGWVRHDLTIQARSVSVLAPVPGAVGGRVVLTIARRDCPAADELATDVRLRVAELRLLERQRRSLTGAGVISAA